MKKSTDELLNILKHTSDLNTYFKNEEENISSCSLPDYLNRLCLERNLSPAECIKAVAYTHLTLPTNSLV